MVEKCIRQSGIALWGTVKTKVPTISSTITMRQIGGNLAKVAAASELVRAGVYGSGTP